MLQQKSRSDSFSDSGAQFDFQHVVNGASNPANILIIPIIIILFFFYIPHLDEAEVLLSFLEQAQKELLLWAAKLNSAPLLSLYKITATDCVSNSVFFVFLSFPLHVGQELNLLRVPAFFFGRINS